MVLSITRGRQAAPSKTVLYGTEGIGKTTLAAQFPGALILDTEDGSRRLDVARVSCGDFAAVEAAMHDLCRDPQGFQTVVIDSVDWAERSLIDSIVRGAGKKSIEDFGFGKGYVFVQERTAKFLALADQLVARGMHVVMVAHAAVKRTSPPDQTDGFDRYELKLSKQTAPLFKEWADLLLFCNYRTKLIEGADGRKKGLGGRERIMFAERSAAFDAKNRYGLPAELPMGIEALAPVFAASSAAPPAEPKALTIDQTIAAIGRATEPQLARLSPRVEQRAQDGELTADEYATLRDCIERRLSELAGMVTA